jgi:hypothetical protein
MCEAGRTGVMVVSSMDELDAMVVDLSFSLVWFSSLYPQNELLYGGSCRSG